MTPPSAPALLAAGEAANGVLRPAGRLAGRFLGLTGYLACLVCSLACDLLGLVRCLAGGVLRLLGAPCANSVIFCWVLWAASFTWSWMPCVLGRLVYGALELHVVVGHLLDLGLGVALGELLGVLLELLAVVLDLALQAAYGLRVEVPGALLGRAARSAAEGSSPGSYCVLSLFVVLFGAGPIAADPTDNLATRLEAAAEQPTSAAVVVVVVHRRRSSPPPPVRPPVEAADRVLHLIDGAAAFAAAGQAAGEATHGVLHLVDGTAAFAASETAGEATDRILHLVDGAAAFTTAGQTAGEATTVSCTWSSGPPPPCCSSPSCGCAFSAFASAGP